MFLLFALLGLPLVAAENQVVIRADVAQAPPAWARLERRLIESMNRAGEEFVRVYVRPDGTLYWKERYEGGMNSSDDAYEAFRGFSLHHALGGSRKLDELHRHVWEGITRQFTRYGQIYREFDSNWDWMHHGEGYVSFYPLGLADPNDERFRERSIRFAAMYIGEEPEAPNYDPEKKIIRASMNGSRGPKMEWSKRDWIPTNANLVYYHLPYDDIPGVESSTGWINDSPQDDQFGRIVKTMSDRMAKGDTAINLTVTPLIANAYLYTGDEKYVRWVKDYVGAWVERTKANGGITPDNVGLSGRVGEYTNGNWWGGYYGWRWPRGGMDIVLAAYTASKVAVLLTGNRDWFELPRSQLRVMQSKARSGRSGREIPLRYDNTRGWHHYLPEPPYSAVNLWAVTQEAQDWTQVEQIADARGGFEGDPDLEWAFFLRGRNQDLPERAFRGDLRFVDSKMHHIRNERGDPETWYDAKWLSLEPMPTDNLVRLTLGGPPVQKRGEMLQARVRYFDADRKQPGLPADVAALVRRIDGEQIQLEIVNTNLFQPRRMIVQAGTYGEHRFVGLRYSTSKDEQHPSARDANWLASEMRSEEIDAPTFLLELAPGAGIRIEATQKLWVNPGSYRFPWAQE